MLPDRVSNPGPLTYESDALPIALRGPAPSFNKANYTKLFYIFNRGLYYLRMKYRFEKVTHFCCKNFK